MSGVDTIGAAIAGYLWRAGGGHKPRSLHVRPESRSADVRPPPLAPNLSPQGKIKRRTRI